MRKRKISKRQKNTIKKMKKIRQVDNANLRSLIEGKLKWVNAEITKGRKQTEIIKIQIIRLEGIKLFIEDLLQPPLEEKKEEKK